MSILSRWRNSIPWSPELLAVNGSVVVKEAFYVITKGSAIALTLAAPAAAQNGMAIVFLCRTGYVHVITATGLFQDGTTGTHNTATAAAYVGATITLIADNGKWNVQALSGFTVT